MSEVTDFQPMDSGARGEPSVPASEIARAAAAAAVRGQPTSQPGTSFTERETLPSEEGQVGRFEEREATGESVDDIIDTVLDADDVTDAIAALTDDEVEALRSAGIDVPALPADAAPEYQDTFTRFAQATLQATREAEQRSRETRRQAAELTEQMRDLRSRLSTPEGQRRLLLTMGLTSPEIFAEARATVERMGEDPEYAEMVRGRLESEARLEAAMRKERAIASSTAADKGRQVEDRTVRAAKRLGVNEDIAKEMVAARILQNEARTGRRDITFQEVDDIMTNLGKRLGGRPVPTKTPEAAARERQAPQRPVSAAGRTPAAPAAESPKGPTPPPSNDPMDALRGAVRASARHLRTKGL